MKELKHIKNIESGTATIPNINFLQTDDCTSGTMSWNPWSYPSLIDTIVRQESIELVYRQDENIIATTTFDFNPPRIKIFKVIYSCKKGKWHKSERIEGSYISASDETYEF